MLIHVEDLKKGDEVLVPSNGQFRLYKVLAEPRLNPKTQKHMAVKCSTYERHEEFVDSRGRTHINTFYDSLPPDQHNTTVSMNFRWKNMWLLYRETI